VDLGRFHLDGNRVYQELGIKLNPFALVLQQRLEILLEDLSNPVRPFDYIVKAGQLACLKTIQEKTMPQYLVAGYLPDHFDPSQADEATGREIHPLNKEMIAAATNP
jgi:hypothetical protein